MASSWRGDYVQGDKIDVRGDHSIGKQVVSRDSGPTEPGRRPPNNILMLMANPIGTDPLRLLEEHRSIDLAIRGAEHRDRLQIVISADTRFYDLQLALPRHRPVAVHFSGHGSRTGGITLSNHDGQPLAVPPRALAETFEHLGASVRCVVLNACATEQQAAAIARFVPCVVGTSRAIHDPLAIEFACGFYAAAAEGKSIKTAFDLGRNRIDLSGWRDSEARVFLSRSDGRSCRRSLHD